MVFYRPELFINSVFIIYFLCEVQAQKLPCETTYCAFCATKLMKEQCQSLCTEDCIYDRDHYREKTDLDRARERNRGRPRPHTSRRISSKSDRAVGRRQNIETLLHDLLPPHLRITTTTTAKPTTTETPIYVNIPVDHIPIHKLLHFTLPPAKPKGKRRRNPPPKVSRNQERQNGDGGQFTLPTAFLADLYEKLPKSFKRLIRDLQQRPTTRRNKVGQKTRNSDETDWNGPVFVQQTPPTTTTTTTTSGPPPGSILNELLRETLEVNPTFNTKTTTEDPFLITLDPSTSDETFISLFGNGGNLKHLLDSGEVDFSDYIREDSDENIEQKRTTKSKRKNTKPKTKPKTKATRKPKKTTKRPQTATPAPKCPKQPGWRPCISKEEANRRFKECCSPLGENCASRCTYDTDMAMLQAAVLQGACPIKGIPRIVKCLSQDKDATKCCEAKGVFIGSRHICKPFCNPTVGLPRADPKYLPCLSQIKSISYCFWAGLDP